MYEAENLYAPLLTRTEAEERALRGSYRWGVACRYRLLTLAALWLFGVI
jgi:hypothetical protein